MYVGEVSLDDPALSDRLVVLRRTAAELESGGVTTKLVIPNSQILYTMVHAPGPDANARIVQIRHGLEGKTPYDVRDLVFDWRSDGQSAQVAVVSGESLKEAESFAVQHGFNPVSFVAIPEHGSFDGEPFFGPTVHSGSLLGHGDAVEPDPEPMIVLGSNRPCLEDTVSPNGPDAPDPRADPSRSRRSGRSALSADEDRPRMDEPAPTAGKFEPRLVATHQTWADGDSMIPLPVRDHQGLTRMPVTSSRIVDSSETHGPAGVAGHAPPSAESSRSAQPNPPGGYRKLGPASAHPDFRSETFAFNPQNPTNRRRWPRLMIVLLALVAIVAACVGLALWISPGQISRDSARLSDLGDSPRAANGDPAPVRNGDAAPQTPMIGNSSHEGTGEYPSILPANTDIRIAIPTRDFSDIGRNPPPDRILLPPPSLAESERTYVATGIWPLDPERPPEVHGDGRTGDIYIAAVDRVSSPPAAAKNPDSILLTAAPKPLEAPAPMRIDKSDYWPEVVDDVIMGSSIRGPDAAVIVEGADPGTGATGSPSSPVLAHVALTMPESHGDPAKPGSGQPSSTAVREGLEYSADDDRSGQSETVAEASENSLTSMRAEPENVSPLAVAVSPRPTARPAKPTLAANRTRNETAGHRTGTTSEGRDLAIPRSVSVARQATRRDVIDLRGINLIGTYGSTGNRQALVRMRSGRVIKDIEVGDSIDGGRVTAIGASELHYMKNGRSVTLRLPSG